MRTTMGSMLLVVALPSAGPQLRVRMESRPRNRQGESEDKGAAIGLGPDPLPPLGAAVGLMTFGVGRWDIVLVAMAPRIAIGSGAKTKFCEAPLAAARPGAFDSNRRGFEVLDQYLTALGKQGADAIVGERFHAFAAIAKLRSARSENLRRHHVEHERLADGLHRKLTEKRVSPVEKIQYVLGSQAPWGGHSSFAERSPKG